MFFHLKQWGRRSFCAAAVIMIIALTCSCAEEDFTRVPIPELPEQFPKLDEHPVTADYNRGIYPGMPVYDPASDEMWQVDLRDYDLSSLDLRASGDALAFASFDDRTVWPDGDMLPDGFDWELVMELGKSPGLSVRKLHERGLTGRGVGIAFIDQPLLTEHAEYAERLQLYEAYEQPYGFRASMHGAAVASIAAGSTLGVAPEADLYFITTRLGTRDNSTGAYVRDFTTTAEAIHRVIEINAQLPEERRIRVLSLSVGWSPSEPGYEAMEAAVAAARAAGIFVVSSNLRVTHGLHFHGLGRGIAADPEDPASYTAGIWWEDSIGMIQTGNVLLVPMDSRTTASPGGADEYVFYREGGWSWSIPYIAGLYALAAQVDQGITPDRFWKQALRTGDVLVLERNGRSVSVGIIVNPVRLLAALD